VHTTLASGAQDEMLLAKLSSHSADMGSSMFNKMICGENWNNRF